MRVIALLFALTIGLCSPVTAQHAQPRRTTTDNKTDIISDDKAAEIKKLIARSRDKQKAFDQRNAILWERWTYAVCLGCGWVPKNVRVVHTHPSRVLIGIPAAEDDARERAGIRLRV